MRWTRGSGCCGCSPEADLAVQAAALFHDMERLLSEADFRIEHRAENYQPSRTPTRR